MPLKSHRLLASVPWSCYNFLHDRLKYRHTEFQVRSVRLTKLKKNKVITILKLASNSSLLE
jgi:hypothetical protein